MKTIALTIDGYQIPIPKFIAAIKTAKANPDRLYKRSIKCWFERTGAEIISEYHEIIDDTINRRAGIKVEELEDYTWYIHAKMLLNGNFIIRENDLPPALRKRFAHRIYRDNN